MSYWQAYGWPQVDVNYRLWGKKKGMHYEILGDILTTKGMNLTQLFTL